MERVFRTGVAPDFLVARLGSFRTGAGLCLLDSARGGRWSVTGLATGVLRVRRGLVTWKGRDRVDQVLGPTAELLPRLLAPDRSPPERGLPFEDGWMGMLGYGASPLMDRIAVRSPAPGEPDDLVLLWMGAAACLDRVKGELHLASRGVASPWEAGDPALGRELLADLERRLAEPPTPVSRRWGGGPVPPPGDAAGFMEAVARAKEHVARGDVFQVNLARRFMLPVPEDPVGLYLALRRANPAPYAGYLESEGFSLLSCSPELLFETRRRRIHTLPIAGTFPRAPGVAEDRDLKRRLRASVKEQAEHVMLVDLMRNDLGRVSEYGSVRVSELMGVRSYATVHHLVSRVEGRLREGVGPFQTLAALFPGGTITGAPKIRAAEVIADLEPVARGPYTGSLGFVDRGGGATWNILIRTLVVTPGAAWVHGGAGVVQDSIPEREARECLQKVRPFLDLAGVPTGDGGLSAARP